MLNKRLGVILGLCITMTCAVCGCGKNDTQVPESVDFEEYLPPEPEPVIMREENATETIEAVESETETETEEVIPFADRYANGEAVSYEIGEKTYETDIVHIKYPVISGMSNTDIQEYINENIEAVALLDANQSDLSYYSLEFTTATKGEGIVSFILSGNMNVNNSAHPVSIVKTLNIDLKTGNNVRVKDYANMGQVVSDLETATGYSVINEGVTDEDFTMFLNNGYVTDYAITMLDYDYDTDNLEIRPTGFSCIRNNHLVLFIEAEHAMGDYVEIEFNFEL